MKRNRIQTFLAIAIFFFILAFPLYLYCSNLDEVNLSSTELFFENPDQDDQFADHQQDGSEAFTLSFTAFELLPEAADIFRHSSYFASQTPFLNQENLILRC